MCEYHQLPLFLMEKRCSRCGELKSIVAFVKPTHTRQCKACKKADDRVYYEQSRDRRIVLAAAWQQANPDKHRLYNRLHYARRRDDKKAYRIANQPVRREWYRRYRAANAERLYHDNRTYRQRNRERIREVSRRYREQNAWKVHLRKKGRRHGVEGRYSAENIEMIYAAQGGLCTYCHLPLNKRFHIEHKQPLSKGGTNWPENICCSCATCNLRKGTMTDREFLSRMLNA